MNFCDACQTCSHCLKKGCIPITPEQIPAKKMEAMAIRHVRFKYKTQRAAAKALRIHPTNLSRMLSGKMRPQAILLQDMGLKPFTVYAIVENIEPQQKEPDASSSA